MLFSIVEREILQNINNPYFSKIHFAFETEDKNYHVIDFVNGGDLF